MIALAAAGISTLGAAVACGTDCAAGLCFVNMRNPEPGGEDVEADHLPRVVRGIESGPLGASLPHALRGRPFPGLDERPLLLEQLCHDAAREPWLNGPVLGLRVQALSPGGHWVLFAADPSLRRNSPS